ncbi:Peptidyl-prolyl cis-trans isomerase [Geitlerinema sp. FC II]|nr:peptidylprolyl isomerase [Geitlerinema sp. CS-897]PPT10208.1 Peptidyl-prolyl cis-trans isomerase [Geitlerinema sp. FC II]
MVNFSPLSGSATAVMVVDGQPIEIFLDGANAPITTGNFADLVERRFYDGVTFHRVVSNFVAQGGDPNSRNPNFPPELLGRSGFIDPATGQEREIPLEIKPEGAERPLLGLTLDEAGITADPVLKNERGTIAMARTTDPNSASSQFYFNLRNNSRSLDGDYAVFGEIRNGLSVMDTIAQGDRIEAARIVDGIIPSRASAFLTPEPLNFYVNRLNRASLPLGFQVLTDNADNLTIDNALSAANPSGFIGFGGNDTITGSAIDDVLYANKGDDVLAGNGGDDLLRGGQGNDFLSGGDGNDIAHGNIGVDTISGGTGNDFLRGGQNEDLILGEDGDDVLLGDRDKDTLTGGTGADRFILRTDTDAGQRDPNAVDVITDFNSAEGDRVVIATQATLNDVRFLQSGADVLLQLSNNDFIGLVQNTSPAAVQAATTIVSPFDLGLAIG